jgi:hypothetical protein
MIFKWGSFTWTSNKSLVHADFCIEFGPENTPGAGICYRLCKPGKARKLDVMSCAILPAIAPQLLSSPFQMEPADVSTVYMSHSKMGARVSSRMQHVGGYISKYGANI